MADAKIITYGAQISAGSTAIPDENATALNIESTDAKDYITIGTVNGSEKVQIGQELIVPDGDTNDPSIRFTSVNTGFYTHESGVAITCSGGRKWLMRDTHICTYDITNGPAIVREAPSATNPVFTFLDDKDTGISRADADQLSLIAGGVEGIRIVESGSAAVVQFGQDNYDPEIQQSSGSNMGYTFKGDTNTGMSSGGASDTLYLTAGNTIGIQITEEIPSGGVTSAVVKMRDAIQYNSGTGSDTANTEPVFLADTNGTMIVDFSNGNFGDITLAANVTAVKFFNAPADGTVATVTAKITQDSSARTFDYSDSAVTVYSDYGSTAVTGEIKFAGGAHHVQSTGSGAVALVSFTCIPSGSTFNIYAAVIGQAFA